MILTLRFSSALDYSFELHKNQNRKGTSTPYIAHLMSVCALVLENGGDEDQAIAALLHDAVEDQGGKRTLAEIERRFGRHVAAMVDDCTDADVFPKPPWRDRKERYLAHLPAMNPDSVLVSMADKVHNARSILRDLKKDGSSVWRRFTGEKEGTIWYYQQLANFFSIHSSSPLAVELVEIVAQMEEIAADL